MFFEIYLKSIFVLFFSTILINVVYAQHLQDEFDINFKDRKPFWCLNCTSWKDENCAVNPEGVESAVQCFKEPISCFTRIDEFGVTIRGCASDLPPKILSACQDNKDKLCFVCDTGFCNVEVFPAVRRSCYRCNSKEDGRCDENPQSSYNSTICPLYKSDDFCATKYVNGYTYRDCGTQFQCDEKDKQHCRHCHNKDGCNTVKLKGYDIGYPGKWQQAPINCYTCKGLECQGSDDSYGLIKKCEHNDLQNCVTVFADNGTVVQRGCSDALYAGEWGDYCDQNMDQCYFCKSSGCNTLRNLNELEECLLCDGDEGDKAKAECTLEPNSISRTRRCHKGCVTGLHPRSWKEADPALELSRGCLDDLDLDDREKCAKGEKAFCKSCTGGKCNTALIPSDRLECNVCLSEDCVQLASKVCLSYRPNDKCFISFENNNVVGMGCASDLDTEYITSNMRHLYFCEGKNCNTYENIPQPSTCRDCNSSVDSNCASNPDLADAISCNGLPHTSCYVYLDKKGAIQRGCLADLSADLFKKCLSSENNEEVDDDGKIEGDVCRVCSGNNCNSYIYPKNRRSCIRCNSEEYSSCVDLPDSFAGICPVYQPNDSCVTKSDGYRLWRGCSSEMSCDINDRSNCRICNQTHNCNMINLFQGSIGEPGKWQELPLQCYSCEGNACKNSLGALRKCERNNLQTCVTVFGDNGLVTKRGCSDEIFEMHGEFCDEHPEKCLGCKSNACNTAVSLEDYIDCYFCDGRLDAGCVGNVTSLKHRTRKCQKSCIAALYPRTKDDDPVYELARTCLDDMEQADREACVGNDNAYCKACNSSKCNTMTVPNNRFECYQCLDQNCTLVGIRSCKTYHPNDECFVLYEEGNILEMGCRSKFDGPMVHELLSQQQMWLCNYTNCNSAENLPIAKTCLVCNSLEDPLCATNPNMLDNKERCAALPYTQCYTRINTLGHTERGCLASLDADSFMGCLNGSDGLCELCSDNECNSIDIFPAERLKCHQCNSLDNTECASAPNSKKTCSVYEANDQCITTYDNSGVTIRGCASSISCINENDPLKCRRCNTTACNTIDLERLQVDGVPGRWQQLPLTCYTCKGKEECRALGMFKVCRKNLYQSCMTVFDSTGSVVERGCSDLVYSGNLAYCDENSDKCLRCNSNGCNVATRESEYVDCLACDSDSIPGCSSNASSISLTRKCYKFCMTALYSRAVEENPSYGLSRGCYDDMDLDDREECALGAKEFCKTCSGSKCNTANMPEHRLSCYHCENENCQDPQSLTCPFYRDNDQCYVRFDEQHTVVKMGCGSEYSNMEANYLLKEKLLYLCDDKDNCNDYAELPKGQTCILCSSRTDPKCATQIQDVKGATFCDRLPFTQCYTRILSDGHTERGCLANLYDDEFLSCLNGTSKTCKSCRGRNCNNEEYPENRLKCHTCNSMTDSNCDESPDNLSICLKYEPKDKCITLLQNRVTHRGCASNLNCGNVTNPKLCVQCPESGCNTVNLLELDEYYGVWQRLPLNCYNCSGADCELLNFQDIVKCETDRDECMTIFDSDNKLLRRGCTSSVKQQYSTYCRNNPDLCIACKSNICNTAQDTMEFSECLYCNSQLDSDCVARPHNIQSKRKCQGSCMTALFKTKNSTSDDYELVRSCISDKEISDQNKCLTGKDPYCKACVGSACNTAIIPDDRLFCYTCSGAYCEYPEQKYCERYDTDDHCYIRFNQFNTVVAMGCTSTLPNPNITDILKKKDTFVCSESNCNDLDELSLNRRCLLCDSKQDINCSTKPNAVSNFKTCNQLPYTSCYTLLANDGSIQRGCVMDLPTNDFVSCVSEANANCTVCNLEGCNRQTLPNGIYSGANCS